jgi:DNA polymerase III sliding clamp (beta) subunit (PCNA family)
MSQTLRSTCDATNDYPCKLYRADDSVDASYLGSSFRDNLKWTALAMSTDGTRRHLACVRLDNDGPSTLIATDGHRLHLAPIGVQLPGSQESISIPTDAVKACLKLKGDIFLRVMGGGVFAFDGSDGIVAFRPVEAAFPPWSQIMPSFDGTVVAVKLASGDVKVWSELAKVGNVKLRFNGIIEANNDAKDGPTYKRCLPGDKLWLDSKTADKHDVSIGVNPAYLADGMCEAGTLRLHGPLDPIRFDGEHGRVAVIMPMRL